MYDAIRAIQHSKNQTWPTHCAMSAKTLITAGIELMNIHNGRKERSYVWLALFVDARLYGGAEQLPRPAWRPRIAGGMCSHRAASRPTFRLFWRCLAMPLPVRHRALLLLIHRTVTWLYITVTITLLTAPPTIVAVLIHTPESTLYNKFL